MIEIHAAGEWVCSTCGGEQICLVGASVPTDQRCLTCRDARVGLTQALRAAEIPPAFISYARRDWELHFQRGWPAELNDMPPPPRISYLWGPTGTGKTTAAAIRLREEIEQGRSGFWAGRLTLEEMLRDLRSESSVALLRKLLAVELLVWDEPLAGVTSSLAAGQVLMIIDHRLNFGKSSLITSQLSPTQLLPPRGAKATPLSAPLGSRLLSGAVLAMAGPDSRLGGAA